MIYRNASLLILITIVSFSCGSTKKTAYFSQQGPAEIITSSEAPKPIIEINDLLSITVSSLSPAASSEFNIPNSIGFTSVSYSSAVSPISGYLVGPDGYIKFPKLGRVKAIELTPNELEDKLTDMLLKEGSLQKPIVTVRQLNFKVTVLGEVARPSVFNIPNARISLLEAIGMAGDMTIYGRRDNVLLIREENKKKITVRINLNSGDLFQSPYYYLKSNDVVYVEPNNSKVSSASRSREVIPIIFSALSFAVIGIDIILRR
jgi:polysaccharide export outer membrane protein